MPNVRVVRSEQDILRSHLKPLVDLFAYEDDSESVPTATPKRDYMPNLRYSEAQFDAFELKYKEMGSQQKAYDALCRQFPKLNPSTFQNFARAYRRRRNGVR